MSLAFYRENKHEIAQIGLFQHKKKETGRCPGGKCDRRTRTRGVWGKHVRVRIPSTTSSVGWFYSADGTSKRYYAGNEPSYRYYVVSCILSTNMNAIDYWFGII